MSAVDISKMPSRTMEAKSKGQRIPSYADNFVSKDTRRRLEHLVAPHVESYNYFVALGMNEALEDLPVNEMMPEEGQHIQMHYTGVNIANPQKNDEHSTSKLTPREARERGLSYSGLMMGIVKITLDDGTDINISVKFGEMPVMVASERCCLNGLNARQLVAMREESNEAGGYFIVNGIERVIRLLQVPRRNHAMALERSSFKNRGAYYSDKGVSMRCVRRDQTSITITLHYLTNGGATLRFVLRKQEFLLPIVMVARALRDISDKELFDRIVGGDTENTFLTARLELILRDSKRYNMFTSAECRAYLGTLFRNSLPISDKTSDEDAGRLLLERFIFVHLDDFGAKQECLIFMIRKLFSFAQGNCAADNADALMNHEILLPGHLLTMIVKEKLEEAMLAVRQAINYDFRTKKESRLADIRSAKYYQRLFDRVTTSVGSKVLSFLSTGNITSSSGLDLMQVSGYTIVAERLNALRFMSHFQSVHRGQFFTTMKTTAVRKLLPESWGFLCPVHTPDGGPCGLLNHMARDAVILAFPANVRLPSTSAGRLNSTSAVGNKSGESDASEWVDEVGLRRLLVSLGVTVAGVGNGDGQLILPNDYITVMIDGDVLGGVHHSEASDIVKQLRLLKVNGIKGTDMKVDPTMEVAYIPPSANKGGAYPGIYIFTQPGRFIRPVLHLDQKQVEWVGPMEQVFMNIACLSQDIRNDTSHIELMPTAMLSQIAALTPFSDYNQSPRNMYQCQMGKQTMGTPAHALKHRNDNKLYRIQNVQAPLVQTKAHREYCMDEYPQGVNAVVAVISYTGFDMEDAMIINKAAYERGFGHGSVYKTQVIDLDEEEKNSSKMGIRPKLKFSNQRKQFVVLQDEKNDEKMSAEKKKLKQAEGADMYEDSEGKPIMTDKFCPRLDYDGLPPEGEWLQQGDPIYCLLNEDTGEERVVRHKDMEPAFIDTVRILGKGGSAKGSKQGSQLRKISITLRYKRNPIIGDKFSSRHGQKGTLSVLWPQENMPFSESGVCPDILINPHAFPSRMTIGMLIESMGGKAAAMHGLFQDSTPFQFHEQQRVIDYVGEQLRSSGFSYYGSEPLYNGQTGNPMKAEIFMGLVFYQRLRHMVSDKYQVRSTGPVMAVTRQPVKGRKKHGGIRLGEMERDSLLSHGVAFCLHDRLMNCSDAHVAQVCGLCGSLLAVRARRQPVERDISGAISTKFRQETVCTNCESTRGVRPVYLPYVYRYLANELAAMGIKLNMTLGER